MRLRRLLLVRGTNPFSKRLLIIPCVPTIRLIFAALVLITSGTAQAAKLQLISVKESSPGLVTATVGLFGGGTPKAPDFRLWLDENPVEAKEVRPVPANTLETSMIVCVDQSGSMGGSVKQLQQGLKDALSKPGLHLNVALWAFDTEVMKLQDFSQNPANLAKSVGEIGIRSYRDGKTKLYEAIELGLSDLRNLQSKGPKHLILITDGRDDGSSITDQVVINEANVKGIVIDAIGFGKVSDKDSELLAHLAKNTGGHFVLPKGPEELSRELEKLFRLPPPRVFDVLFRYETSGEVGLARSARLEFSPVGQASVMQLVDQGLSPPQGSVPQPANGTKGVDFRVAFGGLAAVVAIFVAYLLSRKKPVESKPTLPPQDVPPTAPPVSEPPEPAPGKRMGTRVSFTFPPPDKKRPAAYLDCVSGAAKGRQFPIEQPIFRIGSGNENELQVSDDYVSQKHASIRYDSGSLYLSDSGSRNGTFLNNTRLHHTAIVLTPDDEIRVGRTSFKVLADRDHPVQSNQRDMNWRETQVP